MSDGIRLIERGGGVDATTYMNFGHLKVLSSEMDPAEIRLIR